MGHCLIYKNAVHKIISLRTGRNMYIRKHIYTQTNSNADTPALAHTYTKTDTNRHKHSYLEIGLGKEGLGKVGSTTFFTFY